jgi:hypothetical protein
MTMAVVARGRSAGRREGRPRLSATAARARTTAVRRSVYNDLKAALDVLGIGSTTARRVGCWRHNVVARRLAHERWAFGLEEEQTSVNAGTAIPVGLVGGNVGQARP